MTSRETERAAAARSGWEWLKKSLLGRKPSAPAEELAPPQETKVGPMAGPEAASEPPSLERKKTVVEEYYEKERRERERWESLTPEQKRAERERRRQEFLALHSAAKSPEKTGQAEGIEGGNEREKREKETDPARQAAVPFSSLLPTPEAEKEKGHREKRGRSGSRKCQRVKGMTVSLTPAEYDAVKERARNAEMAAGAYLRACALGDKGPRAKRAPPVNRVALGEAIAALNRVGNNVNQIAHHLNAGGHPDRERIAESNDKLDACLSAILKVLGRAE